MDTVGVSQSTENAETDTLDLGKIYYVPLSPFFNLLYEVKHVHFYNV